MQQFVLIGSQGSFPLPVGESRIGSDAACHICIRGEGILPVHAYVSTDGEKVLIRPADRESSSSSDLPRIAINGKPLNGPTNMSGGQDLALGQVHMRLLANQPPRKPGLLQRKWFRRTLWTAGAAGVLLSVAYVVLMWVILDESRIKKKISRFIADTLMREDDPENESVQVRPFQGEIDIRYIKIKDRYAVSGSSAPLIFIPSLTAKIAVWPLLRSGFKDYTDLDITVNAPEIHLERTQAGTLNINDIVKAVGDRLARSSTTDLGLEKLSFRLAIVDGTIRLNDSFNTLGETRLQNVNIVLRQRGAGQPLEIERFEAREQANKPQLSKEGSLKLTGKLKLLDSSCRIDTSKIYTEGLQLSLLDFDLARIFEHFGYAWEPYNKDFKVVLGKPLNGQATLFISDANHFRVQGDVNSESLVSIVESKNPPIGNIPMRLKFGFNIDNEGHGFLPQDINVELRCGSKPDAPPADIFLEFDVVGGANPNGGSNYTVDLRCTLQDLLGTDVGRRLGLEGTLGGHLHGKASLFTDNGALNADVKIGSEDSYVMIKEPNAEKSEKGKLIRQELPISFDCEAIAQPGEHGGFSHAQFKRLGLTAPSIAIESVIPARIQNLDEAGKLLAEGKFKLDLDGQRFCQYFAPILELFGYTRSVNENFALEVRIFGQEDHVGVSLQGTAARQWKPADPSPVALNSVIDYVAHPNPSPDGTPSPYLTVMLQLGSTVGKPLNVHLKADCIRDEKTESIGLEIYDRDPDNPDSADVAALRERFSPYIESYLENYDALQKGNDARIVRFYRDTILNGSLKPSGRISLQRVLDPKSKDANRIDFDLNVAGKNFTIDMPWKPGLDASAPTPTPAHPAPAQDGRWRWSESNALVGIKGAFFQRLSETKEEPDVLRLNIDALKVEGSLGKFVMSVRDLDLFKLANLATLQNQTWTDTAASLTMSGQVNPPAYDFLRSLAVIPPDYPVSGNLALQAAYDREKDTLDLKQFDFKQSRERPDFFLSSIDVTGAVLSVRDLSRRLLPVGEGAPSFTENFSALLDEGGPAALLDHLGDNLNVNNVQLDTRPLVEWLCKDYRQPQPGHAPPALIAGLLRRDWQPEGAWSAAGVQLSRIGDPKVRTWMLLGGRLRNDFTLFGPPAREGASRPELVRFTHDWELKMGLALSADNTIALNGNIVLDNAFISAAIPRLKYEYKKPAKERCELQIKDCLYSHGRPALAHIGSLELKGKPLGIVLNGVHADIAKAGLESIKIAELVLAGGPLPCGATNLQCDPLADRLELHLHAVDANLAYLAGILNSPPSLKPEGLLKDVDLHYRGSLAAFQSAFIPPAEQAAAFPGIAADDLRLKGLNPETDSLEFDAQLKDVVVSAGAGEDERRIKAALGGAVHLTGRDLTWKDMSADVECVMPAGTVRQTFSVPTLRVNSLDAKLSLSRAWRAPGMPLDISAPLTFTTPLDVNALNAAQSTLLDTLNVHPPGGEGGLRKLATLGQLALSGSLKAPSVLAGRSAFMFVEVPEFSFKNLKLSFPVLTTSLYGGKLTVSEADCDLHNAQISTANGMVGIKNVEHQELLKLVDGDIATVLASGSAPAGGYIGYMVTGKFDLYGTLKGHDFSAENRLYWDGGMKFRIANLAVQRMPAPQPARGDGLPPWMGWYLSSGEKFAAAFAAAAGHDTVSSDAMNAEIVSNGPIRSLAGLIAGIDLYLARSFGVEQERWEFEEFTPTVVVSKGVAAAQPFVLKGKGAVLGLELQVQNLGMNLTDDSLSEATLFPTAIPKSASDRMAFSQWPGNEGKNYLNMMGNGQVPLKIGGTLAVPTLKFPWTAVRDQIRMALFGVKAIEDLTALSAASNFHLRSWPETERATAAALADRMGLGLPGTATGRNQGEMLLDRVVNLPKILKEKLTYAGPTISPLESLQLVLNPPPDPIVPLPVDPREKK